MTIPDISREDIQIMLDKYYYMVVRIAYHYLKSIHDAEDIAQEIFLKYYLHNPEFNNSQHEKAWFIRITINMCKNVLKSAKRRREVAVGGNESNIFKERESYFDSSENLHVLDAVMSLPVNLRSAVYLFYYEDMSIKEIARALDKNESTVGSWLYRARKRLGKLLKESFNDV